MRQTKILMGMPITLEVVDPQVTLLDLEKIFSYFASIDKQFSPYKKTSEVSKINLGKIKQEQYSDKMKEVLKLSEQTKKETQGYFDVYYQGKLDPCGLVKGWAIFNAAKLLKESGFKNYFVDAGGDVQVSGHNSEGKDWKIGIKHPFQQEKIVKVIAVKDLGVATSGTYIRGQHIYDPQNKRPISEIVSLTIIGPNIYEADRFATAAFAMRKDGINFIEKIPGFDGLMIDSSGMATMTSGFEKYVLN